MAVYGVDHAKVVDHTRVSQAAAQRALRAEPQVEAKAQPAPQPSVGPHRLSDEERAEVVRAAEDFNQAFTFFDIQAKFSVHEATGDVIVNVIDTRTGDVIREIPPRELLDRYAQMLNIMGLMVDQRA